MKEIEYEEVFMPKQKEITDLIGKVTKYQHELRNYHTKPITKNSTDALVRDSLSETAIIQRIIETNIKEEIRLTQVITARNLIKKLEEDSDKTNIMTFIINHGFFFLAEPTNVGEKLVGDIAATYGLDDDAIDKLFDDLTIKMDKEKIKIEGRIIESIIKMKNKLADAKYSASESEPKKVSSQQGSQNQFSKGKAKAPNDSDLDQEDSQSKEANRESAELSKTPSLKK